MAKFVPTCRQCFLTTGQTIVLIEDNGRYLCPRDPTHVTKDDVMTA